MRLKSDIMKLLEEASKAYYEGNPVMSDAQFDSLAEQHNWSSVGYELNSSDARITHTHRLYSLQKHFDGEGEAPLSGHKDIVVTPKLDGASVALTYDNGQLTQVLTRGDGVQGLSVTNKFLQATCFLAPKKINYKS